MTQKQSIKQKNSKKMTVSEVLRQAKIDILRKNVVDAQSLLEQLEKQKQDLLCTDLSGAKVCHKVFGYGEILSRENMSVCAKFKAGEKRFVVPNAFTDGFLTTQDENLSSLLLQYNNVCDRIDQLQKDVSSNLVSIGLLEKK